MKRTKNEILSEVMAKASMLFSCGFAFNSSSELKNKLNELLQEAEDEIKKFNIENCKKKAAAQDAALALLKSANTGVDIKELRKKIEDNNEKIKARVEFIGNRINSYIENPKRHKHADLIHAYAEGAEIECFMFDVWHSIKSPQFKEDCKYRIKPNKAYIYAYRRAGNDCWYFTDYMQGYFTTNDLSIVDVQRLDFTAKDVE